MDMSRYTRGSLWTIKDNCDNRRIPGVQSGYRPILILSTNTFNDKSRLINYVTLSRTFKDYSSHINVSLEKDGYIQCEQIQTTNVSRLAKFLGNINEEKLQEVESKIVNQLGLNDYIDKVVDEKVKEKLDSSCRTNSIMDRINIGKERIEKQSKEDPNMNKRIKSYEKKELTYEAKKDIYENYSPATRDYLADKYDISPRSKVSQIAYRLRSNMKKKGHI